MAWIFLGLSPPVGSWIPEKHPGNSDLNSKCLDVEGILVEHLKIRG